jgi:hypothetical protein
MYHEFVIRTKFHIHKSHVRVVISIENLTLVTYIVMCGQRLCKIYIYNIYIYIYNNSNKTCKHNTNAENVR